MGLDRERVRRRLRRQPGPGVYNTNLNNNLTFPNPPLRRPNGGLNQAEDVAVNNATGNVYVSGHLNNRIQEFTQTGGFIRTWGYRSD